MLHIIGLILKIIGIALMVILGILVLLVCSVIFARLKYQLRASCDGKLDSLRVDLKVAWFFRLIRAEVHVAGTSVEYAVKIAWKKLAVSGAEANDTPKEEHKTGETGGASEDTEADLHVAADKKPEPTTVTEQVSEISAAPLNIPEKIITADTDRDTEEKSQKPAMETSHKDSGRKKGIFGKLRAWYEKIKYTFMQFCDKIKVLLLKKEILSTFIEDPIHRLAFAKVLDEMIRFLKHFKPDKLQAELIFGFEDPYLTGKVLAFFGMMYPFWGESVSVVPDFEQRILKGEMSAKGHFRGSYPLAAGIRLLLHKPSRVTFGHIRKFKW